MTIDKSLKGRTGMIRNRSVLTRAERIEKLQAADRWSEGDAVFGLPKVRVQRVALKRKKKVLFEGRNNAGVSISRPPPNRPLLVAGFTKFLSAPVGPDWRDGAKPTRLWA